MDSCARGPESRARPEGRHTHREAATQRTQGSCLKNEVTIIPRPRGMFFKVMEFGRATEPTLRGTDRAGPRRS